MSRSTDPYTQVEQALYVAFEQIPEFANAVKIGNRIRPDSRVPHAKGSTLEADRPELVMRCLGSTPDPFNSSNSYTEIRRFRVSLAFGNCNAQELNGANALEWQVKRCIWRLTDRLPSCPFVSAVRVLAVERDIDRRNPDTAENATREGWYAVADITVFLNLNNAMVIYA